ncbi:Uncharacterised protein [Segatella copri]|nr:Uncharacterised protein [Segatella copri]
MKNSLVFYGLKLGKQEENEHFLKEKRKKCRKNLVISNKSITFALAFET